MPDEPTVPLAPLAAPRPDAAPSPAAGGPARLRDLAGLIRSKNAGPFVLTIDLLFDGADTLRRVVEAAVVTPELVGRLYGVAAETVQVVEIPQAHALKVTLPRPAPAGDPGERDVAGGQQFGRLMDLEVP